MSAALAVAFAGAASLASASGPAVACAQPTAPDRDADGVPDASDLCPDAPEGGDVLREDGCPDGDADHDSVADALDLCPQEAETVNGLDDDDGCPDAAAADLRALGQRIFFVSGSDALDRAATRVVAEVARFLGAHDEITVARIEGHADARGRSDRNEALSVARARRVRTALVAAGVDAARLEAVGLGALPGDSPAIQRENRRADFVVARARGQLTLDEQAPLREVGPFLGRWVGIAGLDVTVGASLGATYAVVGTSAPAWLGPPGSRLRCHGARRAGRRWLLLLRGVDVDVVVALARTGVGMSGVARLWCRACGGAARAVGWAGACGCTEVGASPTASSVDAGVGRDAGADAGLAVSAAQPRAQPADAGPRAAVATPAPVCHPGEAHVTVTAARSWQPTPLSVPAGATLTFEANGRTHTCYPSGCTNACYAHWTGADGLRSCPPVRGSLVPAAPAMTLVARIGAGLGFALARTGTTTATSSGRLDLAVNDTDFAGNSGQLEVTVWVRCP